MGIIRRVFDFKGTPLLVVGFVVLFIRESKNPLRKRTAPRLRRVITNSVTSFPAFTLLRLLMLPVMVKIARKNEQWKLGLSYQYRAPGYVKSAVTVLLLDFSNYYWHILLHKLPFLWRFHLVHHSDRDLDVVTAIRFHFGEIIGSVFFRGAFVLLSGASPKTVLEYEVAFEGATQFHHSNWKIPIGLERLINLFFVTPRMHGIHHSVVRHETDSNYGVIFSFWDRITNTIRLNVPQQDIVIGVPGYNNSRELTVGDLFKLPFKKIPAWPKQPQDLKASRYRERNMLAE